jgi:predicted N-acetyltransferase YhbS
VKTHRDGSRELASLVVAEGWRGRGVGRALVGHILVGSRAPIYLMCRSGLGAFYARFGFQPVAPDALPAYFRHIHRFAAVVQPLRRNGERLLILRRDALVKNNPV